MQLLYLSALACLATVGTASFVQYKAGTGLPLVLSAPHGGQLTNTSITPRDAGCFVDDVCVYSHTCGTKDDECDVTTNLDTYTDLLAQELYTALGTIHGVYPSLVVNTLRRTYLDPNREVNEATFNEPEAITLYNEYRNALTSAKTAIGGPGLLLDLHAHGHSIQRDELGYLVSGSRLDNNTPNENWVPIKSLVANSAWSFEEILRGNYSLGKYLTDELYKYKNLTHDLDEYASVPSPDTPGPKGATYFSGGYITRYQGSRYGGSVDAIQIEAPHDHRWPEFREDYVAALARAVTSFLREHYGVTTGGS